LKENLQIQRNEQRKLALKRASIKKETEKLDSREQSYWNVFHLVRTRFKLTRLESSNI
jgi:hypothetical protein